VFHAFKPDVEGEVFVAILAVEFLDVSRFVFPHALLFEVA
jgi:hypothetical protein